MENTKSVKVVVNVPEKLMKLLKEKNYFGMTAACFWTECIKAGVSCSVNSLDFDALEELEHRFGKQEFLTVLGGEGHPGHAILIH
jgi:hypothetical protein